MNVFPEMKN